MKKNNPVLNLLFIVVIGLVFANCESKNETKPTTPKTLTIAEKKANLDKKKKWEASPDGIQFHEWKKSPEGKKIQASHDKIKKNLKDFSSMDAVVTSVTFQRENAKSGPKWLIVKMDCEEYMMQFIPKDFKQLNSLKVGDKIVVKSRSASFSPNHPYLILSGDVIEHNNTILFKRDLSKNKGC
jgi:sortase (surface protein transpeptidase)